MTQEEKIQQLQRQLSDNQQKTIQAFALVNKSINDLAAEVRGFIKVTGGTILCFKDVFLTDSAIEILDNYYKKQGKDYKMQTLFSLNNVNACELFDCKIGDLLRTNKAHEEIIELLKKYEIGLYF